jgi:hypothetical protein
MTAITIINSISVIPASLNFHVKPTRLMTTIPARLHAPQLRQNRVW